MLLCSAKCCSTRAGGLGLDLYYSFYIFAMLVSGMQGLCWALGLQRKAPQELSHALYYCEVQL